MSVTPWPQNPHAAHPAQQALPRIVVFFEGLKDERDLAALPGIYSRNAAFKDPFNEVCGLGEIRSVYAHMFHALDTPHFIVRDRVAQGQQLFLTWDFRFRFKGQAAGKSDWQTVHGASHLRLDSAGLIVDHRDYWDAAEELYEKLPILGGLMRWLKRRVMRD